MTWCLPGSESRPSIVNNQHVMLASVFLGSLKYTSCWSMASRELGIWTGTIWHDGYMAPFSCCLGSLELVSDHWMRGFSVGSCGRGGEMTNDVRRCPLRSSKKKSESRETWSCFLDLRLYNVRRCRIMLAFSSLLRARLSKVTSRIRIGWGELRLRS